MTKNPEKNLTLKNACPDFGQGDTGVNATLVLNPWPEQNKWAEILDEKKYKNNNNTRRILHK